MAQNGTIFCTVLTDFHNYFTARIRRKFVIIISLEDPTHLKFVATLPCFYCIVLMYHFIVLLHLIVLLHVLLYFITSHL